MPITMELTPEELAVYRATAQRRWEEDRRALLERHARARATAERAAALLKEHFGATRVMAFGSLVHADWFSGTSDLDLAAWGLNADEFFVAVARLQDLSSEFEVDLVAAERCRPELLRIILEEGELL